MTMGLFDSLMDMMDGGFSDILHHCWFCYYLLIITCMTLLFLAVFRQRDGNRPARLGRDWGLMLVIFMLIPVRMICDRLDGGTIRLVTNHVDVSAGGLVYFAACLVVGAARYTRRDLLDRLGALAMIAFTLSFSFNNGFFGHRKSATTNAAEAVFGSGFAGASSLFWSLLALRVTHALVKIVPP